MKLYSVAHTFDSFNSENAENGDLIIYCCNFPNNRMIYKFENYDIRNRMQLTALFELSNKDELINISDYDMINPFIYIFTFNDYYKIVPEEYVQYLKKLLVFS